MILMALATRLRCLNCALFDTTYSAADAEAASQAADDHMALFPGHECAIRFVRAQG